MPLGSILSALSRIWSFLPFNLLRTTRRSIQPVVIRTDTLCPSESESPPSIAFGKLSWHTLVSAPATATDSLTVGVATLPPGEGYLALHRHKQAEVYYILEGRERMRVGRTVYRLRKGDVVFVPGGEEHGIWNGDGREGEDGGEEGSGKGGELKWLYVFAADGFGEIEYRLS